MSNFKELLNKVLEPIQGDPASKPAKGGSASKALRALPKQELERRYVKVMNLLFQDANDRTAVDVFADVVAWKLAVVSFHSGPKVAGDILRKFGAYLVELAEITDAQLEADVNKEEGRQPN